MDTSILIGKMVYTSQPELVSDFTDAFNRPVKVETISQLENAAGFVINGKLLIGYTWIYKLVNYVKEQEQRGQSTGILAESESRAKSGESTLT